MLTHSRRRALGLLIAAGVGIRLIPSVPRAFAQEETEEPEKPDCYETKDFGPWKAQASDQRAGARIGKVPIANPDQCDLAMEAQISEDFDSRIVVLGDPDGTPLPDDLVLNPESRLIAKTADGRVAVDEPLCGNCTDIYDDTVSLVLPLAISPLFREEDSVELVIRLAGKEHDCRFTFDCVTLRQALDWARERRDILADRLIQDECVSPEGCFITTACCDVLGLDDNCFELRSLRRYRDNVLAKQKGGAEAIARYYATAPRILAQLSAKTRNSRLLSVYARFVLPAAITARLGLNALTYRLYLRMLNELAGDHAPDIITGAGEMSAPVIISQSPRL